MLWSTIPVLKVKLPLKHILNGRNPKQMLNFTNFCKTPSLATSYKIQSHVGVAMRAGPPRTWLAQSGLGWPAPHRICELIFLTRLA